MGVVAGDKIKGTAECKYAYITFRNMDAMYYVLESYEKHDGCCKRNCIMYCCGCLCCPKDKEELKKKHLFKQWPAVEVADEPDNIKWENLGISAKSRRIRVCITGIIAIVLVLASLLLILYIKNWAAELKGATNSETVICPEKMKPKRLQQLAWNDLQNKEEDRAGLLHCYCSSLKATEIVASESKGDFWADAGGEWKQVRNIPKNVAVPNAGDKLEGTESYGAEGGAAAWAIKFDDTPYTKFKVTDADEIIEPMEYPKEKLAGKQTLENMQLDDAKIGRDKGVKVFIWDYSAAEGAKYCI